MQDIKDMPIGIQDFPTMLEGNYVYVDKTLFIPMLEKVGRAYFLSRPRRFGKSLFLSTLQTYFEGRKELFKGLAIEKYKKERGEEWQSYPTLKLDLNAQKYTQEEHLTTILNDHINDWCKKYDIKLDVREPSSAMATIIKELYEKFNKKVVVLIDEYDKPLIASLENEKLQDEYRACLKAFYSVIKSLNGLIHMSFITGVTKFSKVSIFSDLNNLVDISFNHEYSTICGLTQEDLEKEFSFNIQELAKTEGVSYNEMLEILKKKYDGYHFSDKLVNVYNPFSICNAFYAKRLGDYWFESGTPTFMVHLLEQSSFDIPDLEKNIVINERELDIYRVSYSNIIPLLFQTGYLTIKDYDREDDTYILGYPNDEVKYAFVYHLAAIYTNGNILNQGDFRISLFKNAMKKGDIDRVLNLIKSLLASIPYDNLPPDKLFLREHNYQTAIYLIFCLMGEYVKTEVHSSKGRSDVEVETKDAIYIFEFKVGGEPIDAIAQIKAPGYADKYATSSKSVYLIGAIIGKEERTLESWKTRCLSNFD